jgi:hypothetical protein
MRANSFGNTFLKYKSTKETDTLRVPSTAKLAPRIYDDQDPRYTNLSLKDENNPRVMRAISYKGFVLKALSPYYHWSVFSMGDGQPIPTEMASSYTTMRELFLVIDQYLSARGITEIPQEDVRYTVKPTKGDADKSVMKILEYRGFVLKQRKPHKFWSVDSAVDGSEITGPLTSTFTDIEQVLAAINNYFEHRKGDGSQ